MENPLLSSPYLVKKRQFCQNYTIFWVQKVNRMPFFPDFSRKNNCSYTHILSKNVHSLKNTLFSCPYFVKKTSILTKTHCSHIIFFSIFHEKPPIVMPQFGQKNGNSDKTTLFYGRKKSIGSLFSGFLRKKLLF